MGVEFGALGGAAGPKQALQELVALPLRAPQLFAQYQVAPPRGILLYGPPGACGKWGWGGLYLQFRSGGILIALLALVLLFGTCGLRMPLQEADLSTPAPCCFAGTGKTVLARAACAAAGARLFVVNGPDVVSEYYGESEAGLRGVFAAARALAPSVRGPGSDGGWRAGRALRLSMWGRPVLV